MQTAKKKTKPKKTKTPTKLSLDKKVEQIVKKVLSANAPKKERHRKPISPPVHSAGQETIEANGQRIASDFSTSLIGELTELSKNNAGSVVIIKFFSDNRQWKVGFELGELSYNHNSASLSNSLKTVIYELRNKWRLK